MSVRQIYELFTLPIFNHLELHSATFDHNL